MRPRFITNCFLLPRDGQTEPLFWDIDGDVGFGLDGYAVIPVELYHALNNATGLAPEDSWPCGECGAEAPTEDGHDPCIANLPGVAHACCGHGCGHAYAMFDDGRTIRGHFDHVANRR